MRPPAQGRVRRFGLSVLTLASCITASAGAETGLFSGPLRFGDQFLVARGRMAVEPAPLEILEPKVWQAELALSVANTFVRSESVQRDLQKRSERMPVTRDFLEKVRRESEVGEPIFFADGEVFRTELRLRRGLAGGRELEFRLPMVQVSGGSLDSLLEGFHDLASLDQDGRDTVPQDTVGFFVELIDRDLELDPATSLSPADPMLTIRGRRDLARPGRRLVWEASAKLPLADEDDLSSSGSLDFALQAQWSSCKARQCRYGALNLRHLGEWETLGLSERLVPGMYVGLEQVWRQASWVVQLMIAGTTLDGIRVEDLHSEVWQLSFGVHKKLGEHYSTTAAITENVAHFENGPDLTVSWSLRRAF